MSLPFASAPAAASNDDPASSRDSSRDDIAQYARAYGFSEVVAEARLRAQTDVGKLVEKHGSGVRVHFDHSKRDSVGILILRAPGENTDALAAELSRVANTHANVQDVPVNDIALRQRVETAARWVKRSQPAIRADAQGDDITGRVTLTVASIEEQTQLDNTAGKPAYVDIITGPVSRPAYNIWAGESTNSCTLGFGVRNQFGTKFASTAGHCPASATYQYGGVQFTTYTAVYFGSSDFRAYNVPGGNIATNILYTGSGTRSITGTTGWSNFGVGSFVCKYGKVTGYNCGNIVTKTKAPNYVPGTQATYVEVNGCNQGSANLSASGDSGGPWFSGNSAWGWMSGGAGPNSCGQNNGIFMAVDYMASGMSVLTS